MTTREKNKYQRSVLHAAGCRPVLYIPALVQVLGSINAAIFISQLLYWHGKGKHPEWTYKTVVEFEEETALTKSQQLKAQMMCVRKGVIQVSHKGVPPKRHFKINVEKVCELLSLDTEKSKKYVIDKWLKTRQSNIKKGATCIDDFLPTITDSTANMTTETSRVYNADYEKRRKEKNAFL